MSLALQPLSRNAAPEPAVPALPEVLAGIASRAAAHDRSGAFPHENFALLQAAGLLGLTVPRAWGGRGAGLAAAAPLIQAVGGACASTGLIFAMQLTQQAALARNAALPEALRARIGQAAATEGRLLNALRVEPELGSPTRGGLPATRVRRQADGSWRLSGRKTYATGAPGLGWMLVWAHDATPEAAGPPRLGHVVVPAAAPGLRIEESWDHLGLRATASHDVVFDDVPLAAEAAADLRPAADWAQPDALGAAWNAVALGALYTGVAEAAAAWLGGFLRGRVPSGLGAPLASLPRLQEAAGGIQGLLAANRRLLRSASAEADAGAPPDATESGLLKDLLVANAVAAVQGALALAGNHALSRRNPLERHWRDVQCGPVHVPQRDAAQLAAGRRALLGNAP